MENQKENDRKIGEMIVSAIGDFGRITDTRKLEDFRAKYLGLDGKVRQMMRQPYVVEVDDDADADANFHGVVINDFSNLMKAREFIAKLYDTAAEDVRSLSVPFILLTDSEKAGLEARGWIDPSKVAK